MVNTAQKGFTLVEVMVSMVLMALVTLATVTLYSATSQSYKTVDASQELNDSARYAFETIGQSLRIAGYQDYMHSNPDEPRLAGKIYPSPCTSSSACPVIGFNNSKLNPTTAGDFGTTNNGGINFSDTLGVTFSGSSSLTSVSTPDKSIVDCQGVAQAAPLDATDLGLSIFWVTESNGEPELACVSRGDASLPGGAIRRSQVIVRGIETFQVMYGIDGDVNSVPEKWVSAQNVSNWLAVRAVRVGFVLRGRVGSSQGTAETAAKNKLYPLGQGFVGVIGSTPAEDGFEFTPPTDGRLRRAFTSTYMLRNSAL